MITPSVNRRPCVYHSISYYYPFLNTSTSIRNPRANFGWHMCSMCIGGRREALVGLECLLHQARASAPKFPYFVSVFVQNDVCAYSIQNHIKRFYLTLSSFYDILAS